MWWCRRFVLVLLMTAVAGCGFRPMYATGGATGDVPAELSAIKIDLVADRSGQELRNHLLDLLTPRGQPPKALYLLKVTLQEQKREVAVKSTGLATRANISVRAKFALLNISTGDLLTDGTARAFSSYNLTDSEFSNLTAEKDTVSRATRVLATDIRSRLAAYFSGRNPV